MAAPGRADRAIAGLRLCETAWRCEAAQPPRLLGRRRVATGGENRPADP